MLTLGVVAVQSQYDSLLHVQGARSWIPCNDGSLLGGFVNCSTFSYSTRYDVCQQPSVMRSWDGGATWTLELVEAPTYSTSGIVRLRGGALLASRNGLVSGFMISDDGGRVWRPLNSTAPLIEGSTNSFALTRDHRGMLHWVRAGGLFASFDSGATVTYLKEAQIRTGVYVLPPLGLIVAHSQGAGDLGAPVMISYDHGRTFSTIAQEHREGLYRWGYSAIGVVRDTLVLLEDEMHPDYPRDLHRTLYWQAEQRSWKEGPYLGVCGIKDGVMDSTGYWYTWTGTGVSVLRPSDSVCTELTGLRSDSTASSDTSMFYDNVSSIGVYYDLNGSIHPYGSLIALPIHTPRPVSRIDRLYICSGIEYVVGGQNLDTIYLDMNATSNAALTYTITPNRRLSTIMLTAVDTTQPMYCSIVVMDSVTGLQRFQDSVQPIRYLPLVSEKQGGPPGTLSVDWSDGPIMWLCDGKPILDRDNLFDGGGSIVAAKTGLYSVRGKTTYGCDVYSNEVFFTSTGTTDVLQDSNGYMMYVDLDRQVHVRWSESHPKPVAIKVYDMLGRLISSECNFDANRIMISGDTYPAISFIVIETSTRSIALGVVNMR